MKCEASSDTCTTPSLDKSDTVLPSSNRLRAAPKKTTKKANSTKSKKQLFLEDNIKCTDEILKLIPTILSKLQKAGHLTEFCNLLRLIAADRFPLQNISFLLLLEVARWYSVDNTTKMFYSDQAMQFWKVFYRLFHGKALRFMMGIKSSGQILDRSSLRGRFDPQDTDINLAVPDIKTINSFEYSNIDIPKHITPGIITQALDMKPKEKKLCFEC